MSHLIIDSEILPDLSFSSVNICDVEAAAYSNNLLIMLIIQTKTHILDDKILFKP